MDRILIILRKENGPRASSAPALGLNTIIFKYVYWYMKQISGERLQRTIGPLVLFDRIRTLVALATYASHRLIMEKSENCLFLLSCLRYLNFVFAEMFIE